MKTRFSLLGVMFFFSGATGLLYEVAFLKRLSYIFGATAYAVSTVLAAFMAGLAIGAHLAGKRAHRLKRPMVAYGWLEITVGLICAVTPLTFDALGSLYVSLAEHAPHSLGLLTLLRAAISFVAVLVPTIAMGATLPVVSRLIASEAHSDADKASTDPRRLPLLYALNTAGGAVGSLVSAYVALPAFGIRGCINRAAIINGVIGTIAVFLGRTSAAVESPNADDSTTTRPQRGAPASLPPHLFFGLAFASGFLIFNAEVVQTHLLTVIVGNSAYAFGLMLFVFLIGLACAAALSTRLHRRLGSAALPLALAMSALSLAVTVPFWDKLPLLFAWAGKSVVSWAGREVVRGVAAIAILSPATLTMGLTFPLLLESATAERNVSRSVGRLTFANTLGSIAGSLLTGYVTLPLLGSQRSLWLICCLFAGCAFVITRAQRRTLSVRTRTALSVAPILLAAAMALLVPAWDIPLLASGANVYFSMGPRPEHLLFVREDVHGGITTVTESKGIKTMYTNGKFQGDDGPEMPAQRRFAHFPSVFVPGFNRALVIGLGTGTTLGTIAAYPYAAIDVAEISPAIVEASSLFFQGPSRNALHDPRVTLQMNDGRNVLLLSQEKYDLVAIELTSIWFAGAASLYSREFYELVRSRLSHAGVLQQWVQLHHMRARELAIVIRTMRSVFPHVALFVGGAQGIAVASTEPLVASEARLNTLQTHAPLRELLAGTQLSSLLSELITGGPELDRMVASLESTGDKAISTDDNLLLEYATPKGNIFNYHTSLAEMLATLNGFRVADVNARHLR